MIKRKSLAIIMAITIIFSSNLMAFAQGEETPVDVISETETPEVLDEIAPIIEIVNPIGDNYTKVSGKTERGMYITIQIGANEYKGMSDINGRFNIDIKNKLAAGTKVKIIVKDNAGNITTKDMTVVDKTAPVIEVVNPINYTHTRVSGKSEPGINVIVKIGETEYKGITDINGRFNLDIKSKRTPGTKIRVTLKDKAGNVSYKDMTVMGRIDTRKANRNITLVSGKKKVTIPTGTSLTVQNSVGDRCLVTYKGVTGYVNSRYLQSGLDYSKFNTNIDAFMNENYIKSDTKYAVVTSLQKKETYVFQGSEGNWKRIKTWKCTIGKPSTPTIYGEYEVGSKGKSFGQDKGFQAKWYTQISGNYLYHSILYNKSGTRVTDGRLGGAYSHGCIRLATENAKWIYDNASRDTKVIIK